ncbi:NAD(P)/FAD-dependent oxidoreductase [Flagellimonas allohymeniacidonis]|uniref:FAD-binding oxidoreductase n=1 Tax=Flagellimonas allohymeniacidonis TaxID=2517819 RepID=A0A4Q8QIQ1_9FLAO|nr:FAD-dependent oxidoreductase [Allomuricauda hymeniacidonis]TAI48076.1 FAD-binding oxidoreductase [Allomuricauda hymeniacidonis]
MVDYLVVGLGLAGISFCETLEKQGKTFQVVSDDSQKASLVAGGLYNPVILKRFTLAWEAKKQMDTAIPFYQSLEEKLGVKLDYKLPVLRRFASVKEQNLWFEAMDKPGLDDFLSYKIVENTNPRIDAPFGLGRVMNTGRVDTASLLRAYSKYLKAKELLVNESFDHSKLVLKGDEVTYVPIKTKRIVFAEGFGLKNNPLFRYLPLNGTKGELLKIKAPQLHENSVIKSSVFIIPLGDHIYRVGATYKWKDKTNEPTEESKQELLTKLKTFLQCDFEVVEHVAGIRPTVVDRRPLVGQHPQYTNVHCLNGFGSRGVLIAPFASNQLFRSIEHGSSLHPEMDIQRFTKKYYRT